MSANKKQYVRFDVGRRIEHILLILSFTTLGLTGLVQKYALSDISQSIIVFLGGIETTRVIHRVAAVVFLLEAIYHLTLMGYKLYVQRVAPTMLPGLKDLTDAFQVFFYNLRLRKEKPKMGRYNFVEKAEYWAMAWGLVVMAVTGFMLWNPIAATRFLPGQFIPAAKAAHGGEALLAVLAIILWHFYSVHIKLWNNSMWTGKLDHHAMQDEHGLELEQIETGQAAPPPLTPAQRRQRLSVFIPVATALTAVLLYGVYGFVNAENTVIDTIPPIEQAEAFVPLTATPFPTPVPTSTPSPLRLTQEAAAANQPQTWEGGIGELLDVKCGSCHGSLGDLSLKTYADVMKGGWSGAAALAGDPDNSPLVKVQTAGGHPGQLGSDELRRVIEWIESGVPEK